MNIEGESTRSRGGYNLIAMQILLVKMSSMGDLVHNCPVVSDIRAHFPDAIIDWVAEEAYVAIPSLHPGVRHVLPVAWRRWRKSLWKRSTRKEMRHFAEQLRSTHYDLTLDTQGLLKSALLCRLADTGPIVGGDWHSIKEGAASLFYDKKLAIAKSRHVIDRCRAVAAGALGYAIDTPAYYGIRAEPLVANWLPEAPYAVLMHAASRPEKLWPNEHWIRIGRDLIDKGITPVLPWGSQAEYQRSKELEKALGQAVVPPLMQLDIAARFLAGSVIVIGLDTGFTHFAAALGRPTIGIFCDSDGEQAAVSGDAACESFGRKGYPPDLSTVQTAMHKMLCQYFTEP